ncbi:MAG: type I restriction-modification system subunit M [Phycisphaerae bacterium]|nr:type I restriction-modification system subunit M [Phycisphaerae bacterium]
MSQQKQTTKEVFAAVWAACDTFRGAVDPANYKNYVLTMLFLKYLSDMSHERREELEQKYKGDKTRVQRALRNERFLLPAESDFKYLYQHRDADNVGELINIALANLEDENKAKLENVFGNVDFNSEAELGSTRERNTRLKAVLEDFNRIDLRPSHLAGRDTIGDSYEYLIARFAAGAGKKAGEFYTPPEVSDLLARLVRPRKGARILDPACGSGSLLIKVGRQVGSDDFALYGQESNGSTWALCKMNMFLHRMDQARIERCDTLRRPKLVENDELMRFDIVVANPPFSLDKWGQEDAKNDRFNRFFRGLPPKSRGDYAFISHMIETALDGCGRVGVIVPHGVLFRGGAEGRIRRQLVEDNLLDLVLGLPPNLFYGTGIPAAILIFDKSRKGDKKRKNVLFIDASREFAQGPNQNRLRDEDMEKICATYDAYKDVEKYAHAATAQEMTENDFNLNIPRYVDTFEEEETVDIRATQKEIERLEGELAKVRAQMMTHLKELGIHA